MNNYHDTDWIGVFIFVIFFFTTIVFGFLIYESNLRYKEHQKFMEEHGCQEIHRSETGRRVWVGKFSVPEYVVVFECKDGMRTELTH